MKKTLEDRIKKLAEDYAQAQKEYKDAIKFLDVAETKIINTRLALEREQEKLRVFLETTPQPGGEYDTDPV